MTSMEDDSCKVCGGTRLAHRQLNHEFSEDGQLRQKQDPPKQRPAAAASGIDLALRMVLIDAGVVSAEDIALKGAELRERIEARRSAADRSD